MVQEDSRQAALLWSLGRSTRWELQALPNQADAAENTLQEYLEIKAHLHAGRTPRPKSQEVSVADICNRFFTSREDRVTSGELSPESFNDYFAREKSGSLRFR